MDGANEEAFITPPQEPQQQRARPLENHVQHPHPPPPPPRCPRCNSSHTKFCYYNNYSLTQPRYFCKSCRRYWTQGGTLRNVPVGGGCRKNKRPRLHGSPSSSLRAQGITNSAPQPAAIASRSAPPPMPQPSGASFYGGGSFMPSLAPMHPSPGGINHGQGAAMMGGGGGSRFGSNMAFLPAMPFPPLNTQAPSHQFSSPPSMRYFQPQQSLIPSGRFSPWTQNAFNNGGASTSSAAPPSGLWSNNGGAGSSEAGSSFTPNQWSDCNQGFKPSDL